MKIAQKQVFNAFVTELITKFGQKSIKVRFSNAAVSMLQLATAKERSCSLTSISFVRRPDNDGSHTDQRASLRA